MSEQRQRASWIVILGCMLACGHSAMPAIAVGADDGFMLYAPSGKQRGLLVVRALTETKGDTVSATLEIVRTAHLGFPASHIAAHPTLPLVYVSGGPGKDGHNAAVVPLDEAGMPRETSSRGSVSRSTWLAS